MKKTGQIAIFVILIALLGLTVILSIASRALSDIKQSTFTDAGVRAFAAAEAGARYVLYTYTTTGFAQGSCSGNVPTGLSFPGIASLTYQGCGGTADYAIVSNLPADDITEVDVSNISQNNVKAFYVVWNNNNAGVEVEMLGRDYSLRRFAWAGSNFPTGSNFYPSIAGTGCVSGNFSLCTNNDPSFAAGSCSGMNYVNNTDPTPGVAGACPGPGCAINFKELVQPGVLAKTIRVKAIGAATGVAVCGVSSGNSPGRLGLQTLQATVSAVTTTGVVKKVEVNISPIFTPAIFDNAIFSGGDLLK